MLDSLIRLFPLVSPFIAAALAFWVATRTERRKESQAKFSAATLLQAEMIRMHRQFKEHHKRLRDYANRMTGVIDPVKAREYPKLQFDRNFPAYQSCIKEVGLFDPETALSIIYFYGNVSEFEKAQADFLTKLSTMENSNLVGHEATNLQNHEEAIIKSGESACSTSR